ncbi:MAG: sigma-70 family RNA polymerase sigma factor [Halioglobus sp.]
MTASQNELERHVSRCAMGDRKAFETLYTESSPSVYAVLMSMLHDAATAQDVLQDTYIKVWNRAGEYHAERGLVLSWIIAIARYRALDLLRASKRRSTYEQQSEQTPTTVPVSAGTTSQLLQECLERLADLQRKSILAAFVGGYTHEELAVREATPVGTIKSRIRRGLGRLRECLEQ